MSNIDRAPILTVIRQLSGQENIFTIPKLYVRFMDGLDGGLFLNQLVFWSDKGKRGDGFIYKSRQEWQEETLVSDYSLRKATKKLKDMGILETKLLKAVGAPTLHYRLDLEGLLEALIRFVDSANGIVEINKSDSSKSTNHGIVENDKSITDEYHTNTKHDVDDVKPIEDERVLLLIDLANDERKPLDVIQAREFVDSYDIDQVSDLVTYTRKATSLRDRLAFVISRLKSGKLPVMPAPENSQESQDNGTYQAANDISGQEMESVDPKKARARGIWEDVLGELQLQMTKDTFTTWLKPARVLAYEDNTLTVAVENGYAKDWLDNRLRITIGRTLERVVGEEMVLEIVVDRKDDE